MNVADRVKETTTATSTATITLGGAVAAFRSFTSSFTVGATKIPVSIADQAGNWETGFYTLTDANTLTRTAIHGSSNGGAAVTFPAGSKEVECTLTAVSFTEALAEAAAAGESSGGGGGTIGDTDIDPADVGFDIVLCIGQSNMCGRGTLDALVDIAESRVYQFGGAPADARYRLIFSGANPIHNQEGVNTGFCSPQVAFGNAYSGMIAPNRKVLLVPAAVGGTALTGSGAGWAPGNPGGTLYENAIAQVNLAITAAKARYPSSRFAGMIWHQGEADTVGGASQAAYAAALSSLISGMRARISGAADSWFVIGGMAPGFLADGYPQNVDLAHKQVATATAKCAFIAGPTGMDDALHYTAAGVRILGAKMAQAVLAAQANSGAVTPATAVTLSGPATGVVNTASSNFTVGTNGTRSGSVVVTPTAVAGVTFSPTSVTLTAGTGTATFTATSTTTGAKSIAVTNDGGLTNPASVTHTVAASATVPGAPTIGAATAGDGTVSVAFTAPASNGGAAITGYTATLYKVSDNSSAGTASGASSPISVTATNGTAVYAKVKATNSVGAGAESAASNSVTPAAAGPVLPTLVNMAFMAATGTANVYAGTTGGFWGTEGYGTLSKLFQDGVDGEFVVQMLDVPDRSSTYKEIGIGLDAASTATSGSRNYGELDYFLMHRADAAQTYTNGSSAGVDSGGGLAAQQNDYLRAKRVGSTLTFAISRDAGATWTTVKTFSGIPTGALYAHVNVSTTASLKIISASGLA